MKRHIVYRLLALGLLVFWVGGVMAVVYFGSRRGFGPSSENKL